jgi:hypothetical protein
LLLLHQMGHQKPQVFLQLCANLRFLTLALAAFPRIVSDMTYDVGRRTPPETKNNYVIMLLMDYPRFPIY